MPLHISLPPYITVLTGAVNAALAKNHQNLMRGFLDMP